MCAAPVVAGSGCPRSTRRRKDFVTNGTRAGQQIMAPPDPATEDDGIRQLSAAQVLAVAALHQGATQTDAAEIAGM